jgi:hypothetical protein
LTDERLETFGCRVVAEIGRLQALLRYIGKNGLNIMPL